MHFPFGIVPALSMPDSSLSVLLVDDCAVQRSQTTSLLAQWGIVPLVAAVMVNSRHAAAQRDEHLRFERLYEASARTAYVVDLDDALRLLALESKGLATGLGAICCTTDETGEWARRTAAAVHRREPQ